MNELIIELRAKRDEFKTAMTAIADKVAAENRAFTEEEDQNFNDLAEKAEKTIKRLEQLETEALRAAASEELSHKLDTAVGKPKIEKISEPELYRAGGDFSYWGDLVTSSTGDTQARERLARHNELQVRAGVVTSDLAGMAPPAYLTDLFAPVLLEGRPFANVVNRKPLTNGTAVLPKGVTGATVANDTEGGTVTDSEPDNTDLTITGRQFSGKVLVSHRALTFGSQTDAEITADLARAYANKIDDYLINGADGVLAMSGFNDIDGSTITGSTDREKFGKLWGVVTTAKKGVAKSRTGAADILVVNNDLWGWMNSVTDSEGRPVMGYSFSAPTNVAGSGDGYVFNGLKVIVDDNLAVALNGSAADTNYAIVANSREIYLFESNGGNPDTYRVQTSDAGTWIVAVGFAGFETERYPTAISIISDIPVGV